MTDETKDLPVLTIYYWWSCPRCKASTELFSHFYSWSNGDAIYCMCGERTLVLLTVAVEEVPVG